MYTSKEEWFSDFRQFAEETLRLVMRFPKSKSDKAKEINKQIKNYRDTKLNHLKQLAGSEHWSNETLLTEIMRLTYVSYIVMLEYRNKVWPYEYMAFARRMNFVSLNCFWESAASDRKGHWRSFL